MCAAVDLWSRLGIYIPDSSTSWCDAFRYALDITELRMGILSVGAPPVHA